MRNYEQVSEQEIQRRLLYSPWRRLRRGIIAAGASHANHTPLPPPPNSQLELTVEQDLGKEEMTIPTKMKYTIPRRDK